MNTDTPTLSLLFDQLGLPSDQAGIDNFVRTHSPLPNEVKLSEADFWTPQQAKLLKDEILEDAEWAPVVDELNVLLHSK
ncbi:DUF2789 domain-containing protein [Pseudomonas sp. Pseusp122]|uniref:DUF2789 domain-containing protein n=1 Tax=unclassified Pseudomonas TaxID=196821 RepID=UPI0039A75A73